MSSFFYPRNDFRSHLASIDGFVGELGYDDDKVSLEDAKKIMQTKEYRQLRTLMRGMRAEK